MAFVRLFKELLKDENIGARWVPIIPDEARTFGMDAMFPTQKIYNPMGQQYLSVDRDPSCRTKRAPPARFCMRESPRRASTASFIAAGSAYATHGEAMIPAYIFYSMFGFQRTADSLWAAMDQMTRGFLLGANRRANHAEWRGTAASRWPFVATRLDQPGVVAYDPAFGYEIAHIVRDGLRRMYGEHAENVFYYLTVYNEPYPQPAEPDGVDAAGILAGMHLISIVDADATASAVQLLASGVAVPWALRAQELLREDWNVPAEVWSVTSWNELRRDGWPVTATT